MLIVGEDLSLASIVCKVLEHIAHSSVMNHFDRHKILTDNQHSFRAKRSCESQLITTIQKIASTMSSKGQADVILLDFAKAFDKVPHQCLLHKIDHYGVCNSTLCWIESFLHHRKQSVLLDGTKSSEADVLSGGPCASPIFGIHQRLSRCDKALKCQALRR